jgi:hypothetical protein
MLDWTPEERALLGDVEPLDDGYTLSAEEAKAALPEFYAARIRRLARAGAHGRHWYAEATPALRDEAARLGVQFARFVDVLALTSPQVSVRRNVALARFWAAGGIPAVETAGVLPSVLAGLRFWRETGRIRGPKTGAFSRALQGDGQAIVLDTWMARALCLEPARLGSKWARTIGEEAVRTIAAEFGWTPAETQAAAWTGAAESRVESWGRVGYTRAVTIQGVLTTT